MAQGCLRCLKLTMCATNFLIFMCGVGVLGYGVYMLLNVRMVALTQNLASLNSSNMLLISGIIITCVSFLGFLGALKENHCLLMTFFLLLFFVMLLELTVACLLLVYEEEIAKLMKEDQIKGVEKTKGMTENSTDVMIIDCCGVNNVKDRGTGLSCFYTLCLQGYLMTLKSLFEENFLTTGISVIVLCAVEVLGMCFAMTLFCHISRPGLGYKL
uniref:Uncharacterized protein n=1 Tax=Mola mola TaxID=94237 RepID=A0A3Q3WCM9_MOLML